MPEVLDEGIRISDLAPLASLVAGARLVANLGGLDYSVTAGQLLALFTEGAPAALDTWLEVVANLEDNEDGLAALIAAVALKAPLASPSFTGVPLVPTAPPGTNTTQASSTAFVAAALAAIPGRVIQRQSQYTGAVATGTTVIPNDDTTPQITEGDPYLSVTMTPQAVGNIIEIDAQIIASLSSGAAIGMGLFQTGVSDALKAIQFNGTGTGVMQPGTLKHFYTAVGTSPITFVIRAGPLAAATLTLNGVAGARRFGGVMNSYLQVTEYSP